MAKVYDVAGTVCFCFGLESMAYKMWLRAFRNRQNNGELDE